MTEPLIQRLRAVAIEEDNSSENDVWCSGELNEAADRIEADAFIIARLTADNKALTAEVDILKGVNANLMGDDEDKPRYTTKRLRQEVTRATEAAEAKLAKVEAALTDMQSRYNKACVDIDAKDFKADRISAELAEAQKRLQLILDHPTNAEVLTDARSFLASKEASHAE